MPYPIKDISDLFNMTAFGGGLCSLAKINDDTFWSIFTITTFKIYPTVADWQLIYSLRNLFCLGIQKQQIIAILLKIHYTATLLSSFLSYCQI